MRLGILISGRGSNMGAVLDAIDTGRLRATCAVVISNNATAAGLETARRHGVTTAVVDHRQFKRDRASFESAIDEVLRAHAVDLVVLAGFMRVLSPLLVSRWSRKIVNIHPSLLPAFPGLHAHRQAVEAGVKVSGCTVHFVDEGTDTGPIIAQTVVPVRHDDTEDTLAARTLIEEHRVLPEVLDWIASGRVTLVEGRVVVDG